MRRYLVAGNWKLNLGPGAGRDLASAVGERLRGRTLHGDVLVCPPFVTIPAVATVAKGDPVMLGAQTCSAHENGAYTGEVAADMLKEAGVQYVIVGHSERRQYHRETDDEFRAKIDRVHAHGLKAIFCFGELLDERQSGRAEEVVRAQLTGVLPRLEGPNAYNLVLAYEPVWAIGTGETATPEIAQQVHAFSRAQVAEILGADVAANMRILYGGSCKPGNARELIGLPDVDGGLIGGASLKAEDFVGIVDGAEAAVG
ncbi:triose-phosphate isomerase [bacterium]|nr:triose-phosphate isomerase [bacterium]PJA75271.1 MAG: triose-phosphate isomerase [bacterium CG_4_9_14_3_um_filter_65_15]